MFLTTVQGRSPSYSHFINKAVETETHSVTCPRYTATKWLSWALNLGNKASEFWPLTPPHSVCHIHETWEWFQKIVAWRICVRAQRHCCYHEIDTGSRMTLALLWETLNLILDECPAHSSRNKLLICFLRLWCSESARMHSETWLRPCSLPGRVIAVAFWLTSVHSLCFQDKQPGFISHLNLCGFGGAGLRVGMCPRLSVYYNFLTQGGPFSPYLGILLELLEKRSTFPPGLQRG